MRSAIMAQKIQSTIRGIKGVGTLLVAGGLLGLLGAALLGRPLSA
jgi:hypothetical protein